MTTPAANVTVEDQKLINKFARLYQNFTQLKEEIKELTNEVQNLNEAADELLLLDGDDAASVPLRIGKVFVHFDSDEMGTKLEGMKEAAQAKLNEAESKNGGIQTEMDQLKKLLYGKFGDRINLEG